MSWHKMTLKVIDVLALLGHRCLGTYQLRVSKLRPYLLICGKFFLYDILCMSFSWFEIDYT